MNDLTKQEVEILKYSGFSNKEIAEKLHLAIQTVKKHKSNIHEKMGVTGGAATVKDVIAALKQGIIKIDDMKGEIC